MKKTFELICHAYDDPAGERRCAEAGDTPGNDVPSSIRATSWWSDRCTRVIATDVRVADKGCILGNLDPDWVVVISLSDPEEWSGFLALYPRSTSGNNRGVSTLSIHLRCNEMIFVDAKQHDVHIEGVEFGSLLARMIAVFETRLGEAS